MSAVSIRLKTEQISVRGRPHVNDIFLTVDKSMASLFNCHFGLAALHGNLVPSFSILSDDLLRTKTTG